METIFRNNCNLKEINAPYDEFALPPFGFQQRKLTIRPLAEKETAENLFSFLDVQAEILESLDIKAELNQACLKLILEDLPILTSLTVDFFRVEKLILYWRHAFPVNTTIASLELIYGASVPEQMALDTLIRGLSNLRHLKCPRIDESFLILLCREVSDLEWIEVENFDVSCLPRGDFFPNIKRFDVESFNEDMEVPLGGTHFEALVSREMMKFFQRKYVID